MNLSLKSWFVRKKTKKVTLPIYGDEVDEKVCRPPRLPVARIVFLAKIDVVDSSLSIPQQSITHTAFPKNFQWASTACALSSSSSVNSCANNLSAWLRRASGNHVSWVCCTPNICVFCANCFGPQSSRITPRHFGFFFPIDETPITCIPKVMTSSGCSCFCMRISRASPVLVIDWSHFILDKDYCAGLQCVMWMPYSNYCSACVREICNTPCRANHRTIADWRNYWLKARLLMSE